MYTKAREIFLNDLYEQLRNYPCVICNKIDNSGVHHIKTRKNLGPDTQENLLPVCRIHHIDIHSKGLQTLSEVYPKLRNWLLRMGWERCEITGKWFNSKMNQINL